MAEHFVKISQAKQDLLILSDVIDLGPYTQCQWCPNTDCAGHFCIGVTAKILKERHKKAERIRGVKPT